MSSDSGLNHPNSANPGDMKVKCPKCGELRGSRVKRRGFFQKQVMPFFGYFPWSCGSCRFTWNSKIRGEKRRRRGNRGPKAYIEPTFDFANEQRPVQPRTTSSPPVPSHTPHHFDNTYDDDTHEDIGD